MAGPAAEGPAVWLLPAAVSTNGLHGSAALSGPQGAVRLAGCCLAAHALDSGGAVLGCRTRGHTGRRRGRWETSCSVLSLVFCPGVHTQQINSEMVGAVWWHSPTTPEAVSVCTARASLFVVGRQVPRNSPSCLSAQVRCCCGVSLRQLAHTCCRRSFTCRTGRRTGCVGERRVAHRHACCAACTPAHAPALLLSHTCIASSTSRGASSTSPGARTPYRQQQAGPAQRAHSR